MLLRLPRFATFLLLALTLASGCSSSSDDDLRDEPAETSAFEEYVGGLEPVDLASAPRPDAPKGFTQRDVDAFADQIVDLMDRSVGSDLDALTPAAAASAVLRDVQPATVSDFERRAKRSTGDTPWEWLVTSTFTDRAGKSKLIKAAWTSDTSSGTTSAGATAPILRVSLKAVYAHDTAEGHIVQQRTISLSSFRPRGGPEWWPSLTATSTVWGAEDCEIAETGRLKGNASTNDLAEARKMIETDTPDLVADPSALNAFRAECSGRE